MRGCLFDTHAHYDDGKFDEDREAVIESLLENGVGALVDIGCSFDSIPKALSIAEKYPFVYASVGLHPNDAQAAEDNPETLDILRGHLENPKVVAIGEIGLDYYWDEVPRETQKKWFREQMALAEETGYPVLSGKVNALRKVLREPLRSATNGSFTGYLSDPQRTECSMIWKTPVLFSGMVLNIIAKVLLLSSRSMKSSSAPFFS